jgi:hypothetical protein
MKTTSILAAILACAGTVVTAVPMTQAFEATAQQAIGQGSVRVTVLHSETGVPLGGMPVTVRRNDRDPVARPPLTNDLGWVEITGLGEGTYAALVMYNNHISTIEYFKIVGDSRAEVVLFFNPDIDGSAS